MNNIIGRLILYISNCPFNFGGENERTVFHDPSNGKELFIRGDGEEGRVGITDIYFLQQFAIPFSICRRIHQSLTFSTTMQNESRDDYSLASNTSPSQKIKSIQSIYCINVIARR